MCWLDVWGQRGAIKHWKCKFSRPLSCCSKVLSLLFCRFSSELMKVKVFYGGWRSETVEVIMAAGCWVWADINHHSGRWGVTGWDVQRNEMCRNLMDVQDSGLSRASNKEHTWKAFFFLPQPTTSSLNMKVVIRHFDIGAAKCRCCLIRSEPWWSISSWLDVWTWWGSWDLHPVLNKTSSWSGTRSAGRH